MYYSLFLTAIAAATCKIILVISNTYTPTQRDLNLEFRRPHAVILTMSKTCTAKFTLEQAMKAQTGSRSIAVLFL